MSKQSAMMAAQVQATEGGGSNEWKNRVIIALVGLLTGGGFTTAATPSNHSEELKTELAKIEVRLAVIETKLASVEQRVKP